MLKKFKFLFVCTSVLSLILLFLSCSDGHHIDAPSVELTVSVESIGSSCISVSSSIPFRITFNKAVVRFDSSKLTVSNGVLEKVSGGPLVFEGTVKPDGSGKAIGIRYDKKGAVDGEGFPNPASNAFEILPLDKILTDQISCGVGSGACCVITPLGEAKCWGSGRQGQLGQDGVSNLGDDPGEMESLDFINLGDKLKSISISGAGHSCGVLTSGKAKCWGANSRGQLGYDDSVSRGDGSAAPHDMASLPYSKLLGLKQIVTGRSYSCGLFINGEVKCWGSNSSGQLGVSLTGQNRGDGTVAPYDMTSLEKVPLGGPVKQISASIGGSVCAVLESGSLKCWGRNSSGGLGYDDAVNRTADSHDLSLLPPVNLGEEVVQVSLSGDHTCALLKSGNIKCWGRNTWGQLGYNDSVVRGNGSATPYDMASLRYVPLGQKVIKVFAGIFFSCALLEDQSLKCWGRSQTGVLGQGDVITRGDGSAAPYNMASLQKVPFTLPIVDINGGAQYICARFALEVCSLPEDTQYKCWGHGGLGQLGQNASEHIGDDPGEIEALEEIKL